MKKVLYSAFSFLFSVSSFGQAINLTSFKTIAPNSIDSCAVPTPAAMQTITTLGTPANNATWDISGLAMQSTFATYAYRAKTSGFSTATYSDSTTYSLSSNPITSYKTWRNINQASGGLMLLGDEVLTRQSKSLLPITGNGIDSFIIPTQVISHASTPLRIVRFPATTGTVWVDSAIRVVNFNLTVNAASLSNTPGQQKQRRIYIDSVVGWGSMKVPIVGKTKSSAIPVLQIHHWDVSIDSFFVNGTAASPAVLTVLGLTQGQTTTVLTTLFYRANATRPLIQLEHSAPVHTSKPSVFYIHAVDLEEETAVPNTPAKAQISIYPNPVVAGSRLEILLLNPGGNYWDFQIFNATGQLIAGEKMIATKANGKINLVIPQSTTPGEYFLMVQQPRKAALVSPIVVK